jgi:hypothetical protein
VQIRRLFVCPCQGESEAKSVAALDFGGDAVAPELAYVIPDALGVDSHVIPLTPRV